MRVPQYEPLCKIFPHVVAIPVTTVAHVVDYFTDFDYAAWPPPSWTSFTAGGGTVAQSAVQRMFGAQSLRITSPVLISYAYARHNIDIGATGKHGLLCWVYVNNFYGVTANDNQFIVAWSAAGRAEMGVALGPTLTTAYHSGTVVVLPCGPLPTGQWHKLFHTLDYATNVWEVWINNVLQATGVEGVALSAPTVLYVGDTSNVVQRGDFFWDAIHYGRIQNY